MIDVDPPGSALAALLAADGAALVVLRPHWSALVRDLATRPLGRCAPAPTKPRRPSPAPACGCAPPGSAAFAAHRARRRAGLARSAGPAGRGSGGAGRRAARWSAPRRPLDQPGAFGPAGRRGHRRTGAGDVSTQRPAWPISATSSLAPARSSRRPRPSTGPTGWPVDASWPGRLRRRPRSAHRPQPSPAHVRRSPCRAPGDCLWRSRPPR